MITTYDKSLDEWLLDPIAALPWNKEQIAKRIREAPRSGTLNLSGLLIMKIPREVWQLTNLTHLNLTEKGFKVFPPAILNMLRLHELDLSFNKITSLPTDIQNITTLSRLIMEKNELTALPTQIGNLIHLNLLDLFGNKITSLPTELGKLKSLEMLIVAHNPLPSLPEEMNGLSMKMLCVPPVPSLPTQLPLLNNLTFEGFALSEVPPIMTTIKILTLNSIARLHLGLFKLTQLTDLTLNGTLTSLPDEIGQLTLLTKLNISNNALTALPSTFAQLVNLTKLTMEHNRFTLFPSILYQLPRLQKIYMQNNDLPTLPAEIDRLRTIRKLDFSNNALTNLPIEMGNLRTLEKLKLNYNPLTSLPLSLGQLTNLTDIDGEGCTQIDSMVWFLVNQQCTFLRSSEANVVLPARFAKWARVCQSDVKLGELSDRDTIILNEWLLRLERTKDFSKEQEALANIVCEMLRDVFRNSAFKELFFAQAGANLECCEDRAAMAFNEMYTSWKVICGDGDLAMMKGVSKTLVLRKELQKLLRNNDELESVEIFLFYELHFKEELGLVTAISRMSYARIGERTWINKGNLIKKVNESWFEELYNLPVFQYTLKKDEEIQKKFTKIYERYQPDLEELEGREDLPSQCQKGEIMQAWEREKMDVALEWFSARVPRA